MKVAWKRTRAAERALMALAALLVGLVLFLCASGEGGPPPAPPRAPRPARPPVPPPAGGPPAAAPTPPAVAPPAPQPPAPQPGAVRDDQGRLLRLVTAGGREWRFERDAAGRVVLMDGPGGPATLAWNAAGRLATRTDATGRRVEIGYDAAGRAISFQAGAARETQTWDARGRLIATSAGAETLRWTYGERPGDVALEDVAAGVTIRYGGTTRRQTVETPFGDTTWVRDERGQVVALETPAGAFRCERDPAGGGVTLVAPNGAVTRLGAQEGRDTLRVEGPQGQLLTQERLFDREGRVTRVTRDGAAQEAEYDAQGRLVACGPERWSYDADGNRTGQSRAGVEGPACVHDARGRLLARGGERFEHDAAGRLVRRETPAGAVTRYAYDGFGRLAAVTRPDGSQVEYAYDPQGRVATRAVRGRDGRRALTRMIWEGQRLLAERGPEGQVRQWVQGPGLDEPLAYRDGDGPWTFLHGDRLGHVLAYSDEQGRAVDAASMNPWGELERAPARGRPVVFAGRVVDPETGLVHMRARWYDPGLGRFISADPAGLAGGENAYAYVRGDPLRRIDPLGLWDLPPRWLLEPIAPWAQKLPPEQQEQVADLAIAAWNLLDLETRERLRNPQDAALWAAELGRRVSEQVRGVEQDHSSLAFLLGEAVGFVKGVGGTLVTFAKEGGGLLMDLGGVGFCWAHDCFVEADLAMLPHYEPHSALTEVFAAGKQWQLLSEIVTGLPERIAEGTRRTNQLTARGDHFAAGEAFGQTILTEAASWLSLAGQLGKGGLALRRIPRGQRVAALRGYLEVGYRAGPADKAFQALVNRLKGAARGVAAETAPPVRPAVPVEPAPQALAPTPAAPRPEPTSQGVVRALTGEEPPPTPLRTADARAPPRSLPAGLSDKGLNHPVPLTPEELDVVRRWAAWRERFQQRWKDEPRFKDEQTKRLLRGKADNAVGDHMKPDDVAGVLKENRGVEIRKDNGLLQDHLAEADQTLRSLRNTVEGIEQRLRYLRRTGKAEAGEIELLEARLADLNAALREYPIPDQTRLAANAAIREVERGTSPKTNAKGKGKPKEGESK